MKLARHTQSSNRSRGFTLIEILFALAILLMGVTSILGLLTFGATMTRAAALRGHAAAAVEAVYADLEERMFPSVVEDGEAKVGEPLAIKDRPIPGFEGLLYSARATPDPKEEKELGHANQYKVDVEIAWTTGGTKHTRTFTTLLLREIPFGERLRREFIEHAEPSADPKPPAK